MVESAIYAPLTAQIPAMPRVSCLLPAGIRLRWTTDRNAAVMMGDIGEEVTEIELEPLPEEVPAEAPAEPAADPTPA